MALPLSRIQESIDAHGWHVAIVPEDDEGPGFAYSIGLYRTLGHPEVIIFGLAVDHLHRAVNDVGAEVRRCRGGPRERQRPERDPPPPLRDRALAVNVQTPGA